MNTNPTTDQEIAGRLVTIVKTGEGERLAKIEHGLACYFVPVSMLSLAAGKDVWMRQILVRCLDCRTPHKAEELECELCPSCFDLACMENERADNA